MANNRLRRDIEQERLSSYETPAEKIIAQGKLLDRALKALGGMVQDNRPQMETIIEAGFVDIPHTPTEAEMVDIGRPEDESEYQAGLGAPLSQDS